MLGHNCGDPLESGLEQLGCDMGVSVTPQGLYDDLKEEGLIGDEYVIPQSPPQRFYNPPWARKMVE